MKGKDKRVTFVDSFFLPKKVFFKLSAFGTRAAWLFLSSGSLARVSLLPQLHHVALFQAQLSGKRRVVLLNKHRGQ